MLLEFKQNRRCPKCHCKEVGSYYFAKAGEDEYERKYGRLREWPKHEFIRRDCKCCQYEWPEKVKG